MKAASIIMRWAESGVITEAYRGVPVRGRRGLHGATFTRYLTASSLAAFNSPRVIIRASKLAR